MADRGIPRSLWLDRESDAKKVDVAVVGGGFVGLSTAYWVKRHGRASEESVVVLEAEHIAGRASGRNAGFLLTGTAQPFARLAGRIGESAALAWWELSRRNGEWLRREILDEHGGKCDFLAEGSWIAAVEGSGQEEELERSARLLAERGFEVEWRRGAELLSAGGAPRVAGAIFQPRDGGLDPVRLCRLIAAAGGLEVMTGARVHGLESRGERILLDTAAGPVSARRVVLALNAYLPTLVPELASEIKAVRGQMLATEPVEGRLEGIWALNHGFEYIRQLADGTLLLGGRRQVSEEVEVGFFESPTATVQGALESFLRELIPDLGRVRIRHRWAGTMAFTADRLPRVGEVPGVPGAIYAAGFSGHGMSLGFAVGRHLARAALGQEEIPLFSPEGLPASPSAAGRR